MNISLKSLSFLIFCALEDKDITGILEELKPRLERVVATRADHPRAPSAEWMAEQVKRVGIPVEAVTPVADALERALELAGTQKLVLSAGSVAFAGEVSTTWRKRMKCKSFIGASWNCPKKMVALSYP